MKYSYDQQIIKTFFLLPFHVNIVSYRYGTLVASSFPGVRSKQCTKPSSNISVLRVTLSVTRLEQRVKST